jgi:hypothetical protein
MCALLIRQSSIIRVYRIPGLDRLSIATQATRACGITAFTTLKPPSMEQFTRIVEITETRRRVVLKECMLYFLGKDCLNPKIQA